LSAYINQDNIGDAKFDSLTKKFVKNKSTHGVFETMQIHQVHGVSLQEKHLARLLKGIESIKVDSIKFSNIDLQKITEVFKEDMQFVQQQEFKHNAQVLVLRYQIILDEKNPEEITRMFKTRTFFSQVAKKVKIKICKTHFPETVNQRGRKNIDRRIYDKARKEIDNQFYDGILCNQKGNVIEGIKTNIFAIKGNTIFTPSLSLGGVAGIMRQVFIERTQEAGLNIIIAPIHYLELFTMDAVFLTNSIIGVVNVEYILRPDRVRSTNIFKPKSIGYQNILRLNVL